jgi:hypothetical protein
VADGDKPIMGQRANHLVIVALDLTIIGSLNMLAT